MTGPEVEREALALFEALLDVAEDERQAWIEARTEGRPALRKRLEAIRDADLLSSLRTGGVTEVLADEAVPERIGAYRIIERIGRGGMGAVYRGEREAGDFHHVVAIKVVKPGVLSDALVERFQRERQTLAALSHPNIAQLYDGGATEAGSPYIVMEYVDGLPLLQWVEETKADLGVRRRVFADICAAVAFAHRNLVVHRDLTPSNVLVSREGRVKLIDFGIARAPEARNLEEGTQPSIASLSLTPGFAAPERMTNAGVALAADVYSLGKLLERLIPPGNDRELKAIVARATAPLPVDRYTSAEALAEDVAAWGAGQPVDAVGGGKRYRLDKFIGRHKLGVSAAAAAVLLLVIALGVTLAANARAERARAAEAQRFEQVRSLARYLLFDLNDALRQTVGNTAARADLANRAQAYLDNLAASPGASPALRLETAQGLIRLAEIQGVPTEPNLGEPDRARANLEKAEAMLAGLEKEPIAGVAVAHARGKALRGVTLIHAEGKKDEARKLMGEATAALDAMPAAQRDRGWFEVRRIVRKAELELSDLDQKPADMLKLANQLEADIGQWPAAMRSSDEAALDRALAAYYRAYHGSLSEREDFGLPLYREAGRRFDALRARHPNDATMLYWASWAAYDGFAAASASGREDLSDPLIRKARDMVDHALRIEPRDDRLTALAANIREAMAQNLRDQDKFAEAIALQKQVVEGRKAGLTRERKARNLSNIGFSSAVLGVISRDAGDRALACSSWEEALRLFLEIKARKELMGFHESFVPGLQKNVDKCRAGAPVSSFGPLR